MNGNNLMVYLTSVGVLGILAISMAILPYLSKWGTVFGVTVPADRRKDPEVKKIIHIYELSIAISAVIAIAILVVAGFNYGIESIQSIYAFNGIVFGLLGVQFFIYVYAYKKMKKLKKEKMWIVKTDSKIIVDTTFRKGKISVSSLWFLAYISIIVATIVLSYIFYENLPDKLPTHFNAAGVADGWANKSKAIYYAPITQMIVLLTMFFSYLSIRKAKQELNSNDPKKIAKNDSTYRYQMSAFIVFLGLALEVIFFIYHLVTIQVIKEMGPWMTMLPIMISFGSIAGVIWIAIARKRRNDAIMGNVNEQNKVYRNDDQYWKLGSFYYNPNDPAIFVEKRVGIGWTCNYGRPISWVITVAIIVVPIVVAVVSIK